MNEPEVNSVVMKSSIDSAGSHGDRDERQAEHDVRRDDGQHAFSVKPVQV
jgi:hypothetical protein